MTGWYNTDCTSRALVNKPERRQQLMNKGYRRLEHTADMGIEAETDGSG